MVKKAVPARVRHLRPHIKSPMFLHRADTWNFLILLLYIAIHILKHYAYADCVHHNLFQQHRRCHINLQHTLFDDVVVSQHLFDHRSLDLLKYRSLDLVQRSEIYLKRRFAIHEFHAAVQQFTDIVHASPYFRNTSVHTEKSIHSLHGSSH